MKTESFISKYVKDVLNNSLLLNTCYFYYLLHVITCCMSFLVECHYLLNVITC